MALESSVLICIPVDCCCILAAFCAVFTSSNAKLNAALKCCGVVFTGPTCKHIISHRTQYKNDICHHDVVCTCNSQADHSIQCIKSGKKCTVAYSACALCVLICDIKHARLKTNCSTTRAQLLQDSVVTKQVL
jgi:hypothetical protein